jgi:hypothetical protein
MLAATIVTRMGEERHEQREGPIGDMQAQFALISARAKPLELLD